jgi:hypothetical protein
MAVEDKPNDSFAGVISMIICFAIVGVPMAIEPLAAEFVGQAGSLERSGKRWQGETG